ncbi:uncharacterized protein MONOS_11234 [Monocercomonoides exilis]|uniref:uncharacterized protein n=1 Tax=Monocercomonoides exilis TaxID=2049356 RepID=UPI003559F24E|nr:hypothetical protein MONOS_11234 [Monocercomonoides exilis]|eukprot:MONOS_11234.1-p1 / transcript=MONOS_11234.1 / gene=MONOS_11234 / organism=Monocercomonoides_exilis_PA203 / gene_product=unspecified product / transcript_product=unspecified product / location=Mono_scaffold00553:4866-5283(-) / protein_length=95 / sequence_SO=supercontig / SO=protein_coding / is_pseudo=false
MIELDLPEYVMAIVGRTFESRRDLQETMTVTQKLMELCTERERIVGKSVVEAKIQETMEEFVAVGAAVPQESVPSIAMGCGVCDYVRVPLKRDN